MSRAIVTFGDMEQWSLNFAGEMSAMQAAMTAGETSTLNAAKAYTDSSLTSYATIAALNSGLSAKQASSGNLTSWSAIAPSAKSDAVHGHTISETTGLQTALDGKEPLVQRTKATTSTTGTYTWTYPVAYGGGVIPVIEAVVQAANGTTDVLNVQLDGAPTNTQAVIRVTRTQQAVVALIGLTILSIPASIGAQVVHITARAP